MGDGAIFNVGDLAEPASKLIDKVSAAIGYAWKPHQMVREAKAEVKANRIRAIGEYELQSEIEERALQRVVKEEARNQRNIESVLSKAVGELHDDAVPDAVSEDWIANLFQHCRITSDEEMQLLWAKVLAGEANEPGSFRKKTVNLLADLEVDDAKLFTKVAGFTWNLSEPAPLIFDVKHRFFVNHDITYRALSHLETLGLIENKALGYTWNGLGQSVQIDYFGRPLEITFLKPPGNSLSVGSVLYTRAGLELFGICGAEPVDEYYEHVVEQIKSHHKNKDISLEPSPPGESIAPPDPA